MTITRPGLAAARARGFSLIEVLVAMLVLGVAVLAFAGLQVRALEGTGVAHMRSQAMTLAAEFVERMRTNPTAMATYRDGTLYTATLPTGEPRTWPNTCIMADVTLAIANGGCVAADMARFDIREVRFLINQLLPAGRLLLDDCTAGGAIDCVFVSWGGVDPADCVDNSSENCVAMRVFVQ